MSCQFMTLLSTRIRVSSLFRVSDWCAQDLYSTVAKICLCPCSRNLEDQNMKNIEVNKSL